jgi:hypothetical protein
MNSEQFKRERLYQSTIAIVKTMLKNGLISEDEFCQIDTMLLEKYRPLLGGLKVGIQQKTLDLSGKLSD